MVASTFDITIRKICALHGQPPYYLTMCLGVLKPLVFLKVFGGPKVYRVSQDKGTLIHHQQALSQEEVKKLTEEATWRPTQVALVCFAAALSMWSLVTDFRRCLAVIHSDSDIDMPSGIAFVLGISSFPSTTFTLGSLAKQYAFTLGINDYEWYKFRTWRNPPHVIKAIDCSKGKLWRLYWQASALFVTPYEVLLLLLWYTAAGVYCWIYWPVFFLTCKVSGFMFKIGSPIAMAVERITGDRIVVGWLPRIADAMQKAKATSLDVLSEKRLDVKLKAWIGIFLSPLQWGIVGPFLIPSLARNWAGDAYFESLCATWQDRHMESYMDTMIMQMANATETTGDAAAAAGAGHLASALACLAAWLTSLSLIF